MLLRFEVFGSVIHKFTMEVEESEKIIDIKERIEVVEGFSSKRQRWAYGGQYLGNNMNCSVYSIPNRATIYVTFGQSDLAIRVFFRTSTGRKIPVIVDSTATVSILMHKVYEQEGICVEQQRLVFGGLMLERDRTLEDYGIQQEAMLHLIMRLRGC